MAIKPRAFLPWMAVSSFLFFFIHQCPPAVFASSKGLSLKLNHHFPQNLTFEERFLRYRRATEARAASFLKAVGGLEPSSSKSHNEINDDQEIYPGVFVEGPYYTVDLQIGYENPRYLELLLDTGSPLTWTQCSSCTNCFQQVEEKYDPTDSPGYKSLPLNDEYCRVFPPPGPQGGRCDYTVSYGSDATTQQGGPVTSGFLGRDTFSFLEQGAHEVVHVPDILFGCGLDNRNFRVWQDECHGYITGIFGMDRSPVSMINQLNDIRGYSARFSYCLRKPGLNDERIYSFLRVGDDIPMTGYGVIQTTPLIKYGSDNHYFVNLVSISVNGHPVQARDHNGIIVGDNNKPTANQINGRLMMVDSGAPGTMLEQSIFNGVAYAIETALAPFRLVKLTGCPYILCYRLPQGMFLAQMPSLQFYFDGGAVLAVQPDSVFSINVQQNYFMLTMLPNIVNILGAHHQHDVRMLYDLEAKQL